MGRKYCARDAELIRFHDDHFTITAQTPQEPPNLPLGTRHRTASVEFMSPGNRTSHCTLVVLVYGHSQETTHDPLGRGELTYFRRIVLATTLEGSPRPACISPDGQAPNVHTDPARHHPNHRCVSSEYAGTLR